MQTSQSSVNNAPIIADQGFRLSYQQRRLWRHAQTSEKAGQAALNAQCGLCIAGDLDVIRLRQSLQQIIDRHEILRTSFHHPAGLSLPVQVIAAQGSANWRDADLCALTAEEQTARLASLRKEELSAPFSLAKGPLLRALLLKRAVDEHLLILTLPALVADARTLRNLAQEVSVAYDRNQSSESQEEVLQYVQLSEWQQSLLDGVDAEEGKAHWHAATGSPIVLPLQRKPHGPAAFIPASCTVPIAPLIAARLQGVEDGEAFLLSCWIALLGRIAGQSSLRIGVTCHGRSYEELEPAMGPVARVVPIQYELRDSLRFSELQISLAEEISAANDWQEYYEHNGDGEPCEAACFEFSEWLPEEPVAGLRFALTFQQSCTDRFHIRLSVTRSEEGIRTQIDYDPQILQSAYVRRLAAQLSTLLAAALTNPETSVDQLPLLGEAERLFVSEECNQTHTEYPRTACLHQLFAAQAARTPHRVAVTYEDASLTYDELDKRANQLAHRLQELHIGPEVRVGIFMHRSLEIMIGLLAILKAGGAYVPLDPAYPAERLAFMLADAELPVLLTQRNLLSLLPKNNSIHVLCLDDPFDGIAGNQPSHEPRSGVSAENLAYTLYTSGSTGKPKGSMITHRSLMNYLAWCTEAYDVASGAGTAVHSSIGFDATITALFPPLLAGRCVELVRDGFGVDGLREAMQRTSGFSLIKITPAHLSLLNEAVAEGGLKNKTRMLVIGGDALAGGRLSVWREHSPQTRFINEYGPTETVVGCCIHEAVDADLAEESVPMGRPIANTQLYILDPQFRLLPTGIPGELFIGGDGVARGYLRRPALTAERFLPDPLSSIPGARIYRTGDLTVRQADGVLNFLGRLDHQVKIRSYRVELGEIEAQLEQCAGVARCVVTAHADSSGEKALVAYIEPTGENTPSTDELRSFLRARLPEHMVPAVFVTLDALPLTAHGKVDRKALPDWKAIREVSGSSYTAPQTSTEETLAAIWCGVLRLERIGIHDDFFRSGGDSIQSILVVARAAKAGLRFTTRDLFQHPTIAELASIAAVTAANPSAHCSASGDAPLTPIQHWFFERQLPEPHHFNQAVLLDVLPEMRFDLLRRALDQLVLHHDALRLRFKHEAEGWRQTHASPEGTVAVCEVNLAGLSYAEQQAAREQSANEAQAGLNLSDGPLIRAVLFRFNQSAPSQLLLVVHHLVIDGVSWRILLEDLSTVYQQLAANEQIQLPARTASFKDWATRLREHSGSAKIAAEAHYWLHASGDSHPLPADFPAAREENTVASSARVRVVLEVEQTSALLHQAASAYRTNVDDLLLTALVQACTRWTGSRSLLIDLEGHGREELFEDVGISRTVGWFTSIYPVRLEIQDAGPGEDLKAIKEQLRRVPQHGIGYGLLRYLSPDSSLRAKLAAQPQAQVSFNYLGQIDGIAATPILGLASEMAGAEEGPKDRRAYLLDVIGQVREGCLHLELIYSTAHYRRATVERLANDFLGCIESLLDHCLSPNAGGFTPSDFPDADLSQEELDGLVADLG